MGLTIVVHPWGRQASLYMEAPHGVDDSYHPWGTSNMGKEWALVWLTCCLPLGITVEILHSVNPMGHTFCSTPWGRVQQQCASRYVHPIGRGTGESVNSMGPGSQRVLIGALLVQTGLIFPFSSWPLALWGPVPIFLTAMWHCRCTSCPNVHFFAKYMWIFVQVYVVAFDNSVYEIFRQNSATKGTCNF